MTATQIEPCPWCGTPVPMRGYRTPAEHPCDFRLVCGAATRVSRYAVGSLLAGRCRNPRSEADGRCYAHSESADTVERRRLRPPGPKRGGRTQRVDSLVVSVRGDDLALLRQAASAAGVSCSRMVHLLIRNHLGGPS